MPASTTHQEPPAIIVQVDKTVLEGIQSELARLAEILGAQVAATLHLTEEFQALKKTLDDVSGEIHDTHVTVVSVRNEQNRLKQEREDAALMAEIAEREARLNGVTESPPPIPNGED